MFTKEEASAHRQAFWTTLGQYVSPMPSAWGGKVNWINYKTGVKGIFFKMDADARQAWIAFVISTGDPQRDESLYRMLETFRDEFEATVPGTWEWEPDVTDAYGKNIYRVVSTLQPSNMFIREQWPGIISFLKERLAGLDLFWASNREIFEMAA